MISKNTSMHCHSCSSSNLSVLKAFSSLKRVTSDCQPWPEGGSLAKCNNCGLVQKVIDQQWQEEIRTIYNQYQIYHQAQGSEQVVFDGASNTVISRSQLLVQKVKQEVSLPFSGRLLDVGCGNGAFLQAFSVVCPDWNLMGSELDDKNRVRIEAIPNVQKLHVGDLNDLNDQFDVISFIHVLEHIPSPDLLLKSLHNKFNPNGVLLIQVPYFKDNPFDLIIADHCSHFTPKTLSQIVQESGYTISLLRTDLISKEITLIATHANTSGNPANYRQIHDKDDATTALQFLINSYNHFSEQQKKARLENQPFGIFGTSIGGVWLFSSLDHAPDFFVDEDKNRIGSELYKVPILCVNDIPKNANVCIPLAPSVAEKVKIKLANFSVNYF